MRGEITAVSAATAPDLRPITPLNPGEQLLRVADGFDGFGWLADTLDGIDAGGLPWSKLRIVAEIESNGNKDIVCYTSKTGSGLWSKNIVSDYPFDQEMYPSITASGEKAICTFIQSGDIYFSTTEDGGTTWSNPIKINNQETSVVEIRDSADVTGPYVVWSDNRDNNTNVYYDTIPAPVISIEGISGGLGVSVTISNTGTAEATDVPWSISIDGGLIFIGNESEGTIDSLPPETSATVTSDFIFGIGRVEILVTTEDNQLTAEGLVLGPFVLGI